ncbi:MAG: putative zinc metalloprotease [Firmicutes bacterium]|nr:putative zinc metalloprotease [Bacillota bacterium]
MKGSFRIGKIKGILIEVNASWFIIFALVTYSLAASYFPVYYPEFDSTTRWVSSSAIALLFFVSVLLHELSHSLVSIKLGMPVKRITLFIFGGVAQIEQEPDEPVKELKMAIAGPAMSIFLCVLFFLLSVALRSFGAPQAAVVSLQYLSTINLTLAIFNLFPAFPLDGGRVLRAIIWRFSGSLQKSTRIASAMGSIFGYFLIAFGIFMLLNNIIINGIWLVFIGWFINQMSRESYQSMLLSDIFDKIKVGEFMTGKVVTIDRSVSVQELVDNYFLKYKFAVFPVSQEGRIIGIVSAASVKQLDAAARPQTSVGSITTPLSDKLVVSPEDIVSEAMKRLSANGVGRVLVMDQENLLGIVSNTDILNYMWIRNQISK